MNINHSIISGNMTRDPEMRSVGADRAVTNFTIANNSKFKDASGEQREEVTFIDCEAWGRQGEIVAQYCIKGSLVVAEGALRQDNWTDKEGQKRSKLKMRCDRVHFTPKGGDRTESESRAPATRATGPARPRAAAPAAPAASSTSGDDETPF